MHRHTRIVRGLAGVALLSMSLVPAHVHAAKRASADATASAAGVVVEQPWARATPPGAHMGAIYMKLKSETGDRLLGAAVPHSVAREAQIHETIPSADGGGAMEMRRVDSLEIPAGKPVALEPGGFHVMLLDLRRPLTAGQRVRVKLRFEHAGTRTVEADVRAI